MRRPEPTLALLMLATAALAACGAAEEPASPTDVFDAAEWVKVNRLGPLPAVPPDPTNRYADSAGAAALGQRLFFETGYASAVEVAGPSGNPGETHKVSCSTCHDPHAYFVDTRRPNNVSHGVTWTARNSPAMVNVAFYRWFSWAGKQDSLWMQGANGPESVDNFAGNRLAYAHLIFQKYRADYDALFTTPLPAALAPDAADAAQSPRRASPSPGPINPTALGS